MDPIIEFHHVEKAFGEKRVYRDLSFEVRAGETLVVMGGSGVGKSVKPSTSAPGLSQRLAL